MDHWPHPYMINHYKIWKVERRPFHKPVTLRGQFDAAPFPAEARAIEYIGNPVRKDAEEGNIPRPDSHLVIYSIQTAPQLQREVVISNQLRIRETLWLGDPELLMLPASTPVADGQPQYQEPIHADHYLCYRVIAPPSTPPIDLHGDLFDQWQQKIETTQRFSAAYFCVPVSKNYRPIHNEHDHLTLYRLTTPDPYIREVATFDQFGLHELRVERSEFLAVPTTKEAWSVRD